MNNIQESHRWGNWNRRSETMYLAQMRYWYNGFSVKAELFPDEDNLRPNPDDYSEEAVAQFQQKEWEYVTLRVTVKDDDGRTGEAWSWGHEYGLVDGLSFSNPLADPDGYPLHDKVLEAIGWCK